MNFGNARESKNFYVDPLNQAYAALTPSNDSWRGQSPDAMGQQADALYNYLAALANKQAIPSMVHPGADVSRLYNRPMFGIPAPYMRGYNPYQGSK